MRGTAAPRTARAKRITGPAPVKKVLSQRGPRLREVAGERRAFLSCFLPNRSRYSRRRIRACKVLYSSALPTGLFVCPPPPGPQGRTNPCSFRWTLSRATSTLRYMDPKISRPSLLAAHIPSFCFPHVLAFSDDTSTGRRIVLLLLMPSCPRCR